MNRLTEAYLTELAAKLGVSEDRCKSAIFWIVDYMLDNISQDAIDCGAYHNSPMNGDRRMIESYKAILWAQYEELNGDKPQAAGPWVSVDPSGIHIRKGRPVYVHGFARHSQAPGGRDGE